MAKQLKDFDSSFKDSDGHVWNVKVTTAIAIKFAGQHNLQLQDVMPEMLNLSQKIDLVWSGIQHHADAKAFDFDGFMAMLEGEAITRAEGACDYALINFTLGRIPTAQRIHLHKLVKAQETERKKILKDLGTSTPTVD